MLGEVSVWCPQVSEVYSRLFEQYEILSCCKRACFLFTNACYLLHNGTSAPAVQNTSWLDILEQTPEFISLQFHQTRSIFCSKWLCLTIVSGKWSLFNHCLYMTRLWKNIPFRLLLFPIYGTLSALMTLCYPKRVEVLVREFFTLRDKSWYWCRIKELVEKWFQMVQHVSFFCYNLNNTNYWNIVKLFDLTRY